MSLRDLYQELILDHGKNPRNFRANEHANCTQLGVNPLCGDRLTLYIDEQDGLIKDVCFEGSGCAISMASASMMSELMKGKTIEEAEALFADFHHMLTHHDPQEATPEGLGKCAVLAGVAEFPARIKCATLAWQALSAALEHRGEHETHISTEKPA